MATVTETGKEIARENTRDLATLKKLFISIINNTYISAGKPNSSEAEQYIGEINAATSMDKLVGLANTFKAKATADFITKAAFPNSSLEYLMAKKLVEAYKNVPNEVTNLKTALSSLELDIHDADGDGSVTDYVKTGANRAKTILDDAPKTPVAGPTETPIGETDGPTETPKPKVDETDGPTKTPKPKVGETDGPTAPNIPTPGMITDGNNVSRDISKLKKADQLAIISHIGGGGTFKQIDDLAALYARGNSDEIAQWEKFAQHLDTVDGSKDDKIKFSGSFGSTPDNKFGDKFGSATATPDNKFGDKFGSATATPDNKFGDKFGSATEIPRNKADSLAVNPIDERNIPTYSLPTPPAGPTPATPMILKDGAGVIRDISGLSVADQEATKAHIASGGTFKQIDDLAALYARGNSDEIADWERFSGTGNYTTNASPNDTSHKRFGGLTSTPDKSNKFGGGTLGSNDSAVNPNIAIPTFPPSNVI